MTDSSQLIYQSQSGLYNVGAYQVSGIPFLTGSTLLSSSFVSNNSEIKVNFNKVVRAVTVINTSGSAILVSFNSITSSNVSGGHHYITLPSNQTSFTFHHRCKEIYISLANGNANGAFELVAENTIINAREMFPLTGSGLTL